MTIRWRIAQFFEMLWWQFYLFRREQTKYLKWKKSYWRQFLMDAEAIPHRHDRILDAGCGPAGIFSILPDNLVDAVDPLLPHYEKKLPHFNPGDYPNVRFFTVTLESYKADCQYDTIFCLNAINHVAHLEAALNQLAVLTCTGGTLLLSTDAHRFRWLKKIFRLIPGDILHPHQHGQNDYIALLEAAGFKIIEAKTLFNGLIFNYILIRATKSSPEETRGALPSRRG